ncbi:MAG: hypothetical protein M3388_00640 [Acidobacteriota bacterium]|nr:hypothetical protein [Acidobacteriota bacterium]
MKSKFLTITFCLFVFVASVFAQNEAERFDEFGELNCEEILARSNNLLNELNKNPTLISYIIFYEGKHSQYSYNKKTQKSETKLINPRRGESRNKAEAIRLYLTKWRKFPKERLILVDGGYRANYGVELWIAPVGAERPKPSPDLKEKDLKYRKGKAPKVADCQEFYSSI